MAADWKMEVSSGVMEEHRELIIGHSINGHLIVVSFTELPNCILRIISARAATTRESHDYEENRKVR